jgi:hypothetical protein
MKVASCIVPFLTVIPFSWNCFHIDFQISLSLWLLAILYLNSQMVLASGTDSG